MDESVRMYEAGEWASFEENEKQEQKVTECLGEYRPCGGDRCCSTRPSKSTAGILLSKHNNGML